MFAVVGAAIWGVELVACAIAISMSEWVSDSVSVIVCREWYNPSSSSELSADNPNRGMVGVEALVS
jgi:hypothetical protein